MTDTVKTQSRVYQEVRQSYSKEQENNILFCDQLDLILCPGFIHLKLLIQIPLSRAVSVSSTSSNGYFWQRFTAISLQRGKKMHCEKVSLPVFVQVMSVDVRLFHIH